LRVDYRHFPWLAARLAQHDGVHDRDEADPPSASATISPEHLAAMLTALLVATNLVTLAALGAALRRIALHRARRKQRGVFGKWPIRRVDPGELDARLGAGPLGPPRESAIVSVATWQVPGGISDLETWVLCNLVKEARLVFELGTATGKTTWLLARNAAADARIVTLTLSPATAHEYRAGRGDDAAAQSAALDESAFASFVYSGTAEAAKVTQVFGDSKAFDESPYADQCDLVFVDGSHARSYVESDSRKALRMVKPGGIVLWHDYAGPHHSPGVFAALNALARELPLVHVAGTMLVAYRRPLAPPSPSA
jgi:hypothetical protein